MGAFSPQSSSSPTNQKSVQNEPNPQDDMQSSKLLVSPGSTNNLNSNDMNAQKGEEEKNLIERPSQIENSQNYSASNQNVVENGPNEKNTQLQ